MRTRARGRRVLLLAAVIAAGVVGVIAVVVELQDGVRHGGPLACRRCDSIREGMPIDIHRSGTSGFPIVMNRGNRDAVLDGLTYERLTPGLRILAPLALRVGDLRAPDLVALARSFPPRRARRFARPLRGFVVHPYRNRSDAVQVLTGFRPVRRGVLGFFALHLRYHVGGKRYDARFPYALVICAPQTRYDGSCRPRG